MTKDEFYNYLEKLEIVLNETQKNQFEIYKDFLLQYNEHTNVTAIRDEKSIYLKHFYDSLTLNNYLKAKDKVLDIGTGAGFPGMVLAIICEKNYFVLLDSNHKKTDFLIALKEKLGLKNVEIINSRAEEYVKQHIEEFDVVTSRAVAHLRILSELSLPALKIGGLFLPMKANVAGELKESLETLEVLNSKIIDKIEICLPFENSKRTILKIKRMGAINAIYPRSYDKILKKPLKKANK